MDTERHLTTDSAEARPIISRVVAQDDRVHVCGITGDPAELFAPEPLVESMVTAAR